MTTRNSNRDRKVCIDAHLQEDENGHHYMTCHCCGLRFNPKTTKWRADHIRRHAHDGPSTGDNLWPIIESHDSGPNGKAARDNSDIAKGKRARSRVYGIKRGPKKGRGFQKPPPGYNPWTRRIERDEEE